MEFQLCNILLNLCFSNVHSRGQPSVFIVEDRVHCVGTSEQCRIQTFGSSSEYTPHPSTNNLDVALLYTTACAVSRCLFFSSSFSKELLLLMQVSRFSSQMFIISLFQCLSNEVTNIHSHWDACVAVSDLLLSISFEPDHPLKYLIKVVLLRKSRVNLKNFDIRY